MERGLLGESKRWNLMASSHYQDNDLASYSGSASEGTGPLKIFYYGLGIRKDFSWGGRLSFDNSLSQQNTSGLVKSSIFEQSLSFSQDLGRNFFGLKFYTSLQEADESVHLSKVILSQKNQKELNYLLPELLICSLKKDSVYFAKKGPPTFAEKA